MNSVLVFLFRWVIGVMFFLQASGNMGKYPVPSIVQMLLAALLVPQTERLLYRYLPFKASKWIKLVVLVALLVLFRLTLPKPVSPPANSIVDASPIATDSAQIATSSGELSGQVRFATESAQYYDVERVVDGDTVRVIIDGVSQPVRIVGVNTPEVVDPRQPVQCFGAEASARAKQLLTGKKVALEPDAQQQDRDKYGRLLRFMFLEDGTDFGLQMITDGYAEEVLYSTAPHKYREAYLQAEARAKILKVGLWADGVCIPTPTPSAASPQP